MVAPDITDATLVTRSLTKTFRDFWLREKVTAVRELDLTIRSGEVYGLLGPNGSGKSTTLKMILGLMFPTRGRISVFGKPPTDVPTKARIGFLPEESYLYPFLNAIETLDYYGRLFHLPRARRRGRIDMLLDMVGLTGMARRPVGEYSKGMQRRIGMAQALINDPDLLILDEPTSGMDPLAARQFKDLINELAGRGKTILLSSHLLADMEDVCDRVGILYGGQLRSEGPLEELLARHTMTQITTEHLDAGVLQRLTRLLADDGRQVLAVETPKERLEALFLRIVREARAAKAPASVVETGQLAGFLRADEADRTREVIDDLLAPRASAAPIIDEKAHAAKAPASDAGKHVLAELMGEAHQPPARTPPPVPPPAPPSAAVGKDADRNVIDGLLDDDQETSDDA